MDLIGVKDFCATHPEYDESIFSQEVKKIEDAGIAAKFIELFLSFTEKRLKCGGSNKCNSWIAYWSGMTSARPTASFRPMETMSAARVSPPDVDLDFDYFRRDEVYEYLIQTYGEDFTCNIGTYSMFKPKAALKATAKAMDLANDWVAGEKAGKQTLAFANEITKYVDSKAVSLDEAISASQELQEIMRQYPRFAEVCRRIEGRISCAGIHAAGIVVSNKHVRELTPMRTSKKVICSQYDKDEVESIGLLKFDILALKNLSIIEDALKMIELRRGEKIDIDNLEPDDPEVFKMLRNGLTAGVFQVEGRGLTRLIMDMQVDCFEDIVAANAIFRPGPLGAKVNELYCDYKLNRKKISYPHPSMKDILDPTYSLIVYQEQVMNLSKAMAGFTSSEADKLRKAIGKKNMVIMAEMKEKFISRCGRNGISAEIAEDTWGKIELFGGYGFNRSHAACYAYIVYQTAYLKRHYTIEYMCALMTANLGDDDKLPKYMDEVMNVLKIPIYRVNVNKSRSVFAIEEGGIRIPLTFVKGVGDVVVRKILEHQPYSDFREFATHNIRVNSKALTLLNTAGALAQFKMTNEQILDYMAALKKEMKSTKVDESTFSTTPSLFDALESYGGM
jgi:DNA polymerase-3 subunit alpha